MPFTQKDLEQAIGSVFIQFWSTQKQLEESQTELAKVKADLVILASDQTPKEEPQK